MKRNASERASKIRNVHIQQASLASRMRRSFVVVSLCFSARNVILTPPPVEPSPAPPVVEIALHWNSAQPELSFKNQK